LSRRILIVLPIYAKDNIIFYYSLENNQVHFHFFRKSKLLYFCNQKYQNLFLQLFIKLRKIAHWL